MDIEATQMKRSRKKSSQSGSVDLLALAECVEKFSGKRIVLLGDFVADEFQSGEISRVSREAPVLILKHRQTQILPGGGANAAHNLATLGARVIPISVVGDDAAGNALLAFFRRKAISTSGVAKIKGWTTPTKTRFLAGWTHTTGQQVLRVDYEPKCPLPEAARQKTYRSLLANVKSADALAVSDYGFGIASPELLQRLQGKRKTDLLITLDARYGLHTYAKCGVSAATPNEAELEAAHHTSIAGNSAELRRAASETVSSMKLDTLLVTRGKHGMALAESSGQVSEIPVHGSDEAVDVTGAGDTVLAAYTLALTCGASPHEAAHIANTAGGLVVMKRGTGTVSAEELLEAIRNEVSGASH
jgi:D-glycero-beta-D-manno-heptose-7-phosphate kinase